MAPRRSLRTALLTGFALLSCLETVTSTSVTFSSCIGNCVKSNGCSASDLTCMCKAARMLMLDTVLGCMYRSCQNELRTAQSTFLGPLDDACDKIGRSIPNSMMSSAQQDLAALIKRLPAVITPAPPPPPPPPPPNTVTSEVTKPVPTTVTVTAPAPTSSASSQESSKGPPASTSAQSEVNGQKKSSSTTVPGGSAKTTTSTTKTTPTVTVGAGITDTTSQASSQLTTTTTTTANGRPASSPDSNPFSFNNGALRNPASYLLAGVPLAVALAI